MTSLHNGRASRAVDVCRFPLLALVLVLYAGARPAHADPPDSADVRLEYVWDLTALYPTPEAWAQAREALTARLPALAAFEGRLGEGAGVLKEALDAYFGIYKDLARLYVYASLKSDEDLRAAEHLERKQAALLLFTDFNEVTSYLAPEVVSLGPDRVRQYLASEAGLKDYDFFLTNTVREAEHVLGKEAEGVLAAASLVTNSGESVYSVLANSDMPWPTVTLSDGTEVRLNQAAYSRYRAAPNRDDRKLVFDAFWNTWNAYKNTYGALLSTGAKENVFYARTRKYPSAVERALADNNIPVDVYQTLIEQTNASLPTLHRYFKLRGRMLGVDQMHYYDIYPPLVEADLTYSVEDAKEISLKALAPLGSEYLDILREGFEARWMHVYPQPGKASGAYMSGWAYDVHPYLLLNHNDDYESLTTFAHEWGHAAHTVLAKKAQPFSKAGYANFTAEIASITNEVLLQDLMVRTAETDDEKLFFLGQILESLRGTFFRQAMFAEFELALHREIEEGRPLSGEKLTELYLDLLRKYHGHREGVVRIDDAYGVEWAYIPHFYMNFYVYSYATSIAGGVYFAQQILDGGEAERERFLNVLRAGGSDYPYQILKAAGVDLASPEPYQALVARMNEVMDQIEEILDRQG